MRAMAETGQPLAPVHLARRLQMSQENLTAHLARVPDTEFDAQGHIVGWGITLVPTQHHFLLQERPLFTWCAFDTVLFPPLHKARSTCPIGMLGVWPAHYVRRYLRRGITDLFPATSVLSLILPAERCDCVRGTFCQQSLFFRSEEAASRWMALHPEAVLHAARGSGDSRANGRPEVAARGSSITTKGRSIRLAQRAARKNIPDRHSGFQPDTS